MMFGVQVKNLAYLDWFFKAKFFLIAMTSTTCLTIVYLCAYPHDKRALDEDDDDM